MAPESHPLDWWDHGGYPDVRRHTGWSLERAHRGMKKSIKAQV
jgi:hypothetical protein